VKEKFKPQPQTHTPPQQLKVLPKLPPPQKKEIPKFTRKCPNDCEGPLCSPHYEYTSPAGLLAEGLFQRSRAVLRARFLSYGSGFGRGGVIFVFIIFMVE